MSVSGIAPYPTPKQRSILGSIVPSGSKHHGRNAIPLTLILNLQTLLKKSVFSRKFYQEINDKILNKTATVDANLYFLCYFTLLVSAILNNKSKILYWLKLQKFKLFQVFNKVNQSIGGNDLSQSENKSINKHFEKPIYQEGSKSNLAIHLKSISSYLADIRIFARLTDSIKYMPWIIDEYKAYTNPLVNSPPRADRLINLIQSLNCLVLELLENAGWLTDHNWVGTSDNAWWSFETYIWCSWVWGAYLVIDIVEMIRRTPIKQWDRNWKVALFSSVVQMPLVLHWSLRNGCLTPFWVGLCGSGASFFKFKDLWSTLEL